jgi:hypothetical protein
MTGIAVLTPDTAKRDPFHMFPSPNPVCSVAEPIEIRVPVITEEHDMAGRAAPGVIAANRSSPVSLSVPARPSCFVRHELDSVPASDSIFGG